MVEAAHQCQIPLIRGGTGGALLVYAAHDANSQGRWVDQTMLIL